jgi:hypothetical protein
MTQAYLLTVTLLLTWKLIQKLIGLASSELRPKICQFLRRRGHVDTLMETLFHLVPILPKITNIGLQVLEIPNTCIFKL